MTAGTTGFSSANDASDHQETAVPSLRRARRWPFVVVIALVLLLVAAVITGAALGSSYQPVRYGDYGGGLGGQIISRQVNNFPPMDGQTYVPPQMPAHGGWTVSLVNNGHFSVTILSASLNAPDAQGPIFRRAQPLRDAGVPTYWPESGSHTGPGKRLAGLTLRPGQTIAVRLPVVTAGCWLPAHGYAVMSEFWIKVKFMFWTHLVPISWTSSYDESEGAIIAHEPMPPSQGGVCPR